MATTAYKPKSERSQNPLKFQIRLDSTTAQNLDALAKETGKSQSAIIRNLINEAAKKAGGA
jgi:predicted DNA-binding protein